ncbi:MAG: aminopeptidase N [Candidatus Nanopelagicales bacterium]
MSNNLNISQNEASQRAQLISNVSYQVKLQLDPKLDTFGCESVIRFNSADETASWIDLIAPKVNSITLNGESLSVSEVFDGARISLPKLASNNELIVNAECAFMNTGEGLHKHTDPQDGEVYLYTQFEVADSRRFMPVFEQPDIKANMQLNVVAPKHWRLISNSPTPEAINHDSEFNLWEFKETKKISSYLFALCAGPYEKFEDEYKGEFGTYPFGIYLRSSLKEHLDAEEIFEITKQGFRWFESKFKIGYPFEKYDQVFVPEFNAGAMENAGCVTFRDEYVFRSRTTKTAYESRANTILHELAHMWFGDLVTMRWWNDLWLNESFAEWAAHWASTGATKYQEAWTLFHVQRKAWAYRQDQLPSTHPIAANMPDLDSVYENFDGITYAKGASALKQLVSWVSEDKFLIGLQSYFQKHKWQNTQLTDLLTELSASSGRELNEWSQVWLETAGATLLRPNIETDSNNIITKAEILQLPPSSPPGLPPVLRPHRLLIGLYELAENKLNCLEKIELDVVGANTEVKDLIGKKRPDLILINDDDLTYAKIRLDEVSIKTATNHLNKIESSLSRALIWGAMWDMLRDAEVTTKDFLKLVINGIKEESDIGVIQQLLLQLRTAIDMYADRSARSSYLETLAENLKSAWEQSAPGSDKQLAFVRAWSHVAQTKKDLNLIENILDKSFKVEGLQVDPELRWTLLRRLVVTGMADDSKVEAELANDPTAMGKEQAAGAKAALPTKQAKENTWNELINNQKLTNSEIHSMLAGFHHVDHLTVLKDFVDLYFNSVSDLWNARTHEIGQSLVTGLFPVTVVEQTVIDKADQFLKNNSDLPTGAKRIIVEQRDSLARALKAQLKDKAS